MTNCALYNTWHGMIARCNNEKNTRYSDYGGRGIKVCDAWLIYENFCSDMGQRPEGHTLDRIDNGGNYCKENCRWATRKEQYENQRSNRWVYYNGEFHLLNRLVKSLLISSAAVRYNMKIKGMTIEQALLHAIEKRDSRSKTPMICKYGHTKIISKYGKPFCNECQRIRNGKRTKDVIDG